MRLINVEAFTEREELIRKGKPVNRRTKVLEFHDDEATVYAILSHRWTDQEVDYDEMVQFAKMEVEERDEIRERPGYRKILASCEQAKRDGHKWLWVDTCCIDKHSSAELSEAINSMYRWYEHSRVCYAYLYDVVDSSFPDELDKTRYPKSNGWPEWFSRGWTLQEMIAPSDVEFFNKDWQRIGNKRILARILSRITGVPDHILKHGISSYRPCVAQIMSWAADRTTTRVEDRAYSLLGLLDVNIPMLYGEGKKAFQRLQLEVIRVSNDQSIFAWGTSLLGQERIGSILADDPRFFKDCSHMELIDHNKFIKYCKDRIPAHKPIDTEHFGAFPVTNRGIQIWMFLRPSDDSDLVFEAWLPCRLDPSLPPVSIKLALWNSSYYRYRMSLYSVEQTLQFRQVYLRYQDTPHSDLIFEIDDSAITRNGFTYCGGYPEGMTGNRLTLTSTDPLCIKVYSHTQTHTLFAVGFGQCFGQHWIHSIYKNSASEHSWENYSISEYDKMLVGGPRHARSMAEVYSRDACYGRLWARHTLLPGSTWTVQTSYTMSERSQNCEVKIDAFQYPYKGPDNWRGFDIGWTNGPNRDIQGLMIPHRSRNKFQNSYVLLVDGISMEWSLAPRGIKLGDYGGLTDSEDFLCEGNIFTDLRSLASQTVVAPRQHRVDQMDEYNMNSDYVEAHNTNFLGVPVVLYQPHALSLPINHDVNTLLASLSTHLTNEYLVTRVIQCANVPPSQSSTLSSRRVKSYICGSTCTQLFHTFGQRLIVELAPKVNPTTPLCIFSKPFIWHLAEGAGSARHEWSIGGLVFTSGREDEAMEIEDEG
ncbi:heterokaryon incompatibility protein-domain-containing protein [Scleroderma yunnanense]